MGTKLKKFNRSLLTKTICFFLAIAVGVLGFIKALDFSVEILSKNEEYYDSSYFETFLLSGNDFNLAKSEVFRDEYKRFNEYAYNKALIYSDKSKNAYEKYQNKYNSFIDLLLESKKASILKEVKAESAGEDFTYTMCVMDKGFISLKKIEALPVDEDMGYNVYIKEDYDYLDELVEQENVNNIIFYDSANCSSYYYDDTMDTTYIFEENTEEISSEIIQKAGSCDCVIKIQNVYKDETLFGGYYAVTVNESEIRNSLFSDLTEFFKYDSYKEFLGAATENEEKLSAYKNLYYAFYNPKSNILYTNHPLLSSKSSEEKIREVFGKYTWNYYKNYIDGEEEYSEEIKQTAHYSYENYDEMFEPSMFTGDFSKAVSVFAKDFMLFTAVEDNMKEEDSISAISSNYENLKNKVCDFLCFEAIMIFIFIVLFIKLILSSGRTNKTDEVTLLLTDKIFTSVRYLTEGALIIGCAYLAIEVLSLGTRVDETYYIPFIVKLAACVVGAVIIALILDLTLYTARLIKKKAFFKNFIIGRIIYYVKRTGKQVKEKHRQKKAKPLFDRDIFKYVISKLAVFVFVPNIIFAYIFLVCLSNAEWLLVLLFIYDCLILIYMVKYAYYLRTILKALNEIRLGNYNVWVETHGMPKSVIPYAEDVNAIRNGLKIAVENAIKEERTKTELITNVSHDLKTPLTSIITYVDLLSRCDIEDENAKEYIGVLTEKGLRLKRLIEDLVEASKASSGNIECNLIKISLNELIMQIAAEYEDEFVAKGLKLVIGGTELNLSVLADGQMSYRILDNLMVNIKKYAMANTRVYLDITKADNMAVVIIRNISDCQLNISAKELMERFVRGDSSRTTEGNGLGLSIAENLAKLQGGSLNIEINGDLFTAKIEFLLSE